MQVPFLHLKKHNLKFEKDYQQAFSKFLKSGEYVLGRSVKEFEKEFSNFVGSKFAIGVSNCLDGLEILLKTKGIGVGDEVIVPSNTYIATWLAIINVGATPIPVEPNINTFNIDHLKIEESISKRTKAIMVVHLYGLPCDMDPINEIAKRYRLFVFEDSAQAHGSQYKSKFTGNLGHASAFSFYPSKNIGALGDAGIITTNDEQIYEKALLIRNYGSKIKYQNKYIGRNNRLDELQAKILLIRMRNIHKENQMRQKIAERYLKNLSEIRIPELRLPEYKNQFMIHTWHLFVILTPLRDNLKKFLSSHGIDTMLHYPICPHKQDALKGTDLYNMSFPISEEIHQNCLSLPISSEHNLDEIDYVCEKIKVFFLSLT